MASPESSNSAPGKWIFVNRQGEEELLDDDTSSTSSASSSEFVKMDGDEVSYHQRANNTTAASSLSGDKTCDLSALLHHSDLGGSGEMKDASTPPRHVPELCSSDKVSLSEEESDGEIFIEGPNQEVARGSSEEKCSNEMAPSQHASCVSTLSSEDLPQFRLVLVPRSLSFTDSDSDFSNLDSTSNPELSEAEELPHKKDVNFVDPGFCFADHGYVADTEDRQNALSQEENDGGQEHLDMINPHLSSNAPDTGQRDVVNDADHEDHDADVNYNQVDGNHVNEEVGNDDFQVIGGERNADPIQDDPIQDDNINHEIVDEAESGTESGAEDDRIESDQSDGLPADDEDDLSFSNVGLENLSLHEMNLTRHYIHRPNKYLSGTLSLIVIMAGWMALGLGIGHSLGSSKQNAFHSVSQLPAGQIKKLHQTQENLSLCLLEKGDILRRLRRERHDWDNQKDELTNMWEARGKTISQLSDEVKNWRIKVNELQKAKKDLEIEIVRMRYHKHPGNGELNTGSAEMAVDEEIIIGVKDKQERLSSIPIATNKWENQMTKLRQELVLAQDRASMWQRLYRREQNRKPPMVTTPDMFSCLMMLTPPFNFSDVVRTLNNSIVKSFMELPNISLVKSYINNSFKSEKIVSKISEFQALFEELSKVWRKRSSGPTGSDFEKEPKQEKNHYKRKWENEESDHQQRPWVESIKQFLNETQNSVAKVSHEIKKKMKQMKDLSEDLWEKHQPAVSKWQEKLSHRIAGIGEKIREEWQKHSNSWFKRKTKRRKGTKHNPGKKNDLKQRKRHKGKTHKSRHHGSSQKEDKRLVRGQRKVVKKVFKILAKKIKRMNLKSYAHQGIDGVERMVAEIDSFRVSHGNNYPDKKMKLWINCQFKWWESKLLMENFDHRNCGKALLKWQVKVEKMDWKWRKTDEPGFIKQCHNKNTGCDKGGQHKQDKDKPRHQEARKGHKDERFEGIKRGRLEEQQQKRQYMDEKSEHGVKTQKSAQTPNATEEIYPTKSGSWYFKQQRHKMYGDKDSWYVRKMVHQKKRREQERDSPDGSWVFRRADDRDFYRKRPDDWYFRRLEGTRKTVYRDNVGESFYGSGYDTDESYEYFNGYGFTVCL